MLTMVGQKVKINYYTNNELLLCSSVPGKIRVHAYLGDFTMHNVDYNEHFIEEIASFLKLNFRLLYMSFDKT